MDQSQTHGIFIGNRRPYDGAGRSFDLIAPELAKLGISLHFAPARGVLRITKSLCAYWIQNRFKVDFLLFNSLGSLLRPEAYILAKLARLAGIPALIYWREMSWSFNHCAKSSPWRLKIVDAVAKMPHIHHLANSQVCAGFIEAYYQPKNGVQVAGNCAATGICVKDSIPAPSSPPFVVGVGSIQARKGIDLFIETAIEACGKDPQIEFVWIGPGALGAELTEKIEAHGLRERIIFTGPMNRPDVVLRRASVFFCPSREETFSQATAEAMSLGRNIVTFANGGPPEILKGTGIVIPDFNTSDASAAIIECVRRGPHLNLAAKKIYDDNYAPQIHARRLHALIHGICARSPGTAAARS